MSLTPPPVKPSERVASRPLSLSELFEAEEGPLLRYAFSLVGRRAVAEEIVQEVFLQLHRRWAEVEKPAAWLYRCVRNQAYNHHRDTRREVAVEEGSEPVDTNTADHAVQRLEAAGFLRRAIMELAEPDRELIRLKYYEGLKYKEIGRRSGMSSGNVGYRLHHILKHLGEKLRRFGIDGATL